MHTARFVINWCVRASRYFVPNPAAKGRGWFGTSGGAQQSVDPGFAGQQQMLKTSEQSFTAKQQIHVTAHGRQVAPGLVSRLSHDAEKGRRTSDDVVEQVAKVQQPKQLELLKGVSGYAVPGKLMALMGGSGAGEGGVTALALAGSQLQFCLRLAVAATTDLPIASANRTEVPCQQERGKATGRYFHRLSW